MTAPATVSNLVEVVSHTYSTEVLDDFHGEGFCNLHLWTLGRNSEPYLLRIRDFPIFCHLELPLIVNNQYTSWSDGSAAQVVEWLTKVLKDHAPYGWRFKQSRKLYYYRGDRLYPMILLKFKSLEAMKHCRNLLNKHHRIFDLGLLKLEMHETDITPIRKLFSLKKCRYSQWFRIQGIEVPYDSPDRISTRGTVERPIRELVVAWETLTPVHLDESRSWTTQPRILSFDIETYSDNHRAFPNPLTARHVVYITTCVYQILGKPESREKYAIVYGECDEIPGVKIITVTNELDLISAFCKLINEKDPEILTGHNILGFDYPFLDVRLKTKMRDWPEVGRLSGVQTVMTSKTWQSDAYGHNTINILEMSGRLSIDMLPIVRRDYKLDKYTLDYIGKHFLNKGKHEMSVEFMFRSYDKMQKALEAVRKETGARPGSERVELQRLTTVTTPIRQSQPAHRSPPRIRLSSPLPVASPPKDPPVERAPPSSAISDLPEMMRSALEDLTLVVRYGVQDSDIAIELFEKLNVWIGLIELSNIVGVSVMEIFTRGQQIRCKSQLYDKASEQGFVIDRRIMARLWSSGGFVGDVQPGIHENILCFDFASLYPSIIEAYNICYTTLVPPEIMDQIPDDQATLVEFDQSEPIGFKGSNFGGEEEGAIDGYESEAENNEVPEDQAKTVKKHYKYKWIKPTIRRGLLPQIVHDLVAERNQIRNVQMPEIKKLIKEEKQPQVIGLYELQLVVLDKRQNALKVSANSIFGFLGAQSGLMPLIEGSMCITAMGRQLIGAVNTYLVQSYNAVVVYNDTDSAMVDLHLTDRKDCHKWGNRIAEEISGVPQHEIVNPDGTVTVVPSKPGLFPPPLRIEFEKAMRLANFTKKKYAAFIILPNGEYQLEKTTDGSIGQIYILTRGIVLARRDNCAWLRKVYAPLLRAALNRQHIDVAFEMVVTACADLLEGKVPVEGNLTMIRELGSNYKAANYFIKLFADELRKMGKPANPGDRLEYVVVKTDAEKRGETVLLGKKMRSIEMYNESRKNAGAETGEASGLYPVEDIDYEYYIGHVLINPIDQLFGIGYVDVLQNYRHLEYKSQHSRLHPVSVETPVKMVTKMMTDLQRGGYTLENLGPAIRSLGPWFRAQKEYLEVQTSAVSNLANGMVKLRIRR